MRDNLTPTVYNTWFAPIEMVEFTDGVLILRVKSQFVVEYIEENYIDLLGKAIVRVFGKGTQ
ncbi:MAG: chromosomal replication initiator protein DnaA, partial [Bacteroidales bacterium]|nr:chromosomal replication initiator protein DnaA [Candidatus Colicola coprequi]